MSIDSHLLVYEFIRKNQEHLFRFYPSALKEIEKIQSFSHQPSGHNSFSRTSIHYHPATFYQPVMIPLGDSYQFVTAPSGSIPGFPNSLLSHEFDFSLTQEHPDVYIDDIGRVKKIITDICTDNKVLEKLSARDFEEVVAELLRYRGFEVELTKKTRDGGFDIWAIKRIDGLTPFQCLVECKRKVNGKAIGIDIVRSFSDVVREQNANKGILVTTSYFSPDAQRKQALTPYLLDLKDREDIIDWAGAYIYSGKL